MIIPHFVERLAQIIVGISLDIAFTPKITLFKKNIRLSFDIPTHRKMRFYADHTRRAAIN